MTNRIRCDKTWIRHGKTWISLGRTGTWFDILGISFENMWNRHNKTWISSEAKHESFKTKHNGCEKNKN